MKPQVVLVSDDKPTRQRLERGLSQSPLGPSVVALDWQQLQKAPDLQPDLMILDRQSHQGNVLEALYLLRQRCVGPILVLGNGDTKNTLEMVAILEAGADFYLSPPFSHQVLLARIGVLLRRWDSSKPGFCAPGDAMSTA